MISRLLNQDNESETHKILMEKAEKMAMDIQSLNEMKLNCSLHIKNLITSKYQEFKFDNVMQHQPWDLTPGKFVPTSTGTSTPLALTQASGTSTAQDQEKVPKKRGRKPKISTSKESKHESAPSLRDSVESNNLMMLADVALIKMEDEEEEEGTKNVAFGKLPVTKHSKKNGKNRKGRKSKSIKEEDESDSESDVVLPETTDENEPLYCLCNRVSFGNMVECSNEACSIEWFHFGCVGMKKAPKGKWFCPKCRSRSVRKIKKEFND